MQAADRGHKETRSIRGHASTGPPGVHRLALSEAQLLESGDSIPSLPWGLQRQSISHGHGYKAKHLNYVLVLASKMTSVWVNLFLLAFYYFFNCSCSKTLKKKLK